MKKIFLFAIAVVTMGLVSCDIDNVENIGEMSTSEFPKTDGDIEAVLAGVYQNLNTTHANPQCSFLYAACLASDDQLGGGGTNDKLMQAEDDLERSFYEKECIAQKWDVRTLRRQMSSALYLRLAASKDKDGVLALAKDGITVQKPEDVVRDSYTLEFLGIHEDYRFSETLLEQRIIENLQLFLLEMGKGFTFVKRQYPISVNNRHYHCDLVFYHRILRCFVLIDLKRDGVQHEDIGQMNMYLGYFAKEENLPDDNPPIGIILSHYKDNLLVEYATYGMNTNLFVSKYELYLPDKEQLRQIVEKIVDAENTEDSHPADASPRSQLRQGFVEVINGKEKQTK